MIFVRLSGGLGNQIFQFGFALLIREGLNNNSTIVLDCSGLGNYKVKRNFTLNKFFKLEEFKVVSRPLISRFRLPKIFPCKYLITDKNAKAALIKPSSNCILDGYFQDCLDQKSFNEIRTLLLKYFRSDLFDNKTHIGELHFHIRGGDFLDLGFSGPSQINYYKKAILVAKNFSDYKHVNVFTDDLDFTKSFIKELNLNSDIYSSSLVDDFVGLSCCNFVVSSSSTFSFWALALSPNEFRVIFPSEWTPGRPRNILLPGEVIL